MTRTRNQPTVETPGSHHDRRPGAWIPEAVCPLPLDDEDEPWRIADEDLLPHERARLTAAA